MLDPEHFAQLFVVRFWLEWSDVSPPGQWRGSVEHVPSGQRLYFVALRDLTDFISVRLDGVVGTTDDLTRWADEIAQRSGRDMH